MAGLTHTIGGVSFNELNSSAGRKSLGCFSFSAQYDIKRFHAGGTDGNFIVRAGRNGGRIVAFLGYLDSLANILSNYQNDREAWENTAVTIVDSAGESFLRCQLDPGGMNITQKPIAIGRSGLGYMEAVATFTRDS